MITPLPHGSFFDDDHDGDDGPEADAGPDNPNDVSLTVPK